ncbi:MAG TPA: VWA domain-containing protein [Bryobacteraceae bacterium]|nr:VWA domain-containing protein [Bryobacteraceae bacterium]
MPRHRFRREARRQAACAYRFPRAVLATLVFLAVPLAAPSQEPPRVVIRTETQLVLVDATVQDKKGNPILDLAAKDFHVLEDGKPQEISSFSLETSSATPDKSSKHYLVLFFDDATMSTSAQLAARRDAAKFVNAWAAPDRYMSVIDFGPRLRITQGFTSVTSQISQAVSQVQASGQSSSDRDPIQLENRNTAPATNLDFGALPGFDAAAIDPPTRTTPARGRPGPPSTDQSAQPSGASFAQQDMLAGLQSVAGSLASIRGRKDLVLFTSGFPSQPSFTQLSALIAACNEANVAVYVAHPSAFRALADGTGGRAIANTNDMVSQLGRIAESEEQRYVLGYTPADSTPGACHNLRVTVDRAGAEVDARKGYCASKPMALVAPKAPEPDLSHAQEQTLAASMQLPYFYSSPNVARVNLAMEIDPGLFKFDKEKGKPHAELRISGVASLPDGSVAGRFDDTAKIDLESEKDVQAFSKQPYHYEYQFELAPAEYKLQVTVSQASKSLGVLSAPLSIAPWNGSRLAISGIALSRQFHPVADLASSLDDASLEDQRQLIAGGRQIVPSGSDRLPGGGAGFFYVEVYDPEQAGPNPPALAIHVRILDPKTGQTRLDAGAFSLANAIRKGNPVVPVAANLPPALPPGNYRLELTAGHPGGPSDTAASSTDFEIAQ